MSTVETDITTSNEVAEDGLDRKTLFVRSIPFEATSDELSEYFSQFAPVKHAVIVTDNEKKSRGFGFVSFTLEDDTVTALVESKKTKFKGRYLRVDVAKRRDRKDKKETAGREGDRNPVEKRRARLIIRNLPWSCKNPDELRKIFSKYGAVFDAYIPRKKGGQMSGFAFVTMKKKAAAEKAVSSSVGLKIDGREVAVDLALEKSHWEKASKEESEKQIESQDSEEPEDSDLESDIDESGKDETTKVSDKNETEDNDDDSDNEESSDEQGDEFEELNNLENKGIDTSDAENGEDDEGSKEEIKQQKKKANRQESFCVFVRNIPYDADEESLREHFKKFGPVKYALPVVDKNTGVAKGSAFVAFYKEEPYTSCIENSPSLETSTMLIADDVSPDYVYQGRILTVTSAVDRSSAHKLAERNSSKRLETLGKAPGEKDKRSLFLLNEGRITERSKLAQVISKTDLELREKSYKLRSQQLSKNPSLFLSLTRLAVRNLPRAMNSKALKALGRKAVVNFATEVKEEVRQPLSKEEIDRSITFRNQLKTKEDVVAKNNKKHQGVVKQAKVIYEVKGSGEAGRSRGYGFIEFRDHKTALMGLRWLNAHAVTTEEILEGLTEEEKKNANLEALSKRRLIVEFAIENAQVVKRRQDRVLSARFKKEKPKRKRDDEEESEGVSNKKSKKSSSSKGEDNNKASNTKKSEISDDVKKIIGSKRKKRKGKK